MTSYDSDSSIDDNNDQLTNVTLGYASTESTGDDISHIGGYPSWLDSKSLPNASMVRCKICNSLMTLLLQLQADSQQFFPNDQRRLFVWCCRRKPCLRKPGSIRSFREVKRGKQAQEEPKVQKPESNGSPKQDLGSQLFGGKAAFVTENKTNPFSTGASLQTNGNPFAGASSLAAKPPQTIHTDSKDHIPTMSFAEKLKISQATETKSQHITKETEPWPDQSAFPKPYPSFFLDAETEYLNPEPPEPFETQLQPTLDANGDTPSSTNEVEQDSKDAFESALDRTFQKFSDIIAQNPEQILRYELKGQPLLYSGIDSVATHFVLPHSKTGPVKGIPRCESCGAARVFEVQLVPGLIYELEKDDEGIGLDEGMEWGTIIVGSCERNCGEDENVAFREEWTGVQWEERTTAMKSK